MDSILRNFSKSTKDSVIFTVKLTFHEQSPNSILLEVKREPVTPSYTKLKNNTILCVLYLQGRN